jgi:taurine dioxygenase
MKMAKTMEVENPKAKTAYETITVTQLSPNVGAEIGNIDLTKPLSPTQVKEVRAAITAHGVIFFREQPISFEDHDRFVRYFGEPHEHIGGDYGASKRIPDFPGIREQYFDGNSKRVAGEDWHSDQSYGDKPPTYSILHQKIVPTDGGGDTMFMSCSKAYDELSDTMKDYLRGKTVTHMGGKSFDPEGAGKRPEMVHPAVTLHPESGRKVLFVNPSFTSHINGVPKAESKAVLQYLYEHMRKPHWHMRFHWRDHSIAMWDNRAVQHMAIWDYWPQVRLGYRMFVQNNDAPAMAD